MIVVDANIVIYYCIRGPLQDRAQALWRMDHQWHAPELWRSEVLNVLAGEVRGGRTSLIDATVVSADAEACIRHSHPADAGRVLQLVTTSRCTAYDLQYVGLAQQLQVKLITMDGQLLREFPEIAQPLPG